MDNKVDASTGTISLGAKIPNPKKKLLPGQFVNIKLVLGEQKDAILIPKSAIQIGPSGQFVYTIDTGNKARVVNIVANQQFEQY